MTTVKLNLPEELQEFLNNQTEAGQFNGPDEYTKALIERAKNGKDRKDRLESLLVEGLDSGNTISLDADENGSGYVRT